ncbi:MAG: hypothetical protein Q8M12_00165, partial [bacterium]|nr:hypothetical protein [bacterium]
WSGMEVFKESLEDGPEELGDMDTDFVKNPAVAGGNVVEAAGNNKTYPKTSNYSNKEAIKKVYPTANIISNPAVPVQKSVPKAEVVPAVVAKPEAPKEMFSTICATCEEPISVPFKPDPSRPAFCRECLKDHQRLMARRKISAEKQDGQAESAQPAQAKPAQSVREKSAPVSQQVVYAPQDKPLSLSQMSHIAPKKFKPQRQKPNVDLESVRALLNQTKQ